LLIALLRLSSPVLLLNELAGKRSDDDSSLRSGNLSDEPPNLLEVLALNADPGQRDSPVDPLTDEPARDSKSAPAASGDAAPALSLQLAPNPLAPQVPEPPPLSFDPNDGGAKLVPIEPPPVPSPAVAGAYSPIVCASACGANSASTAISTAGTISLMSLMAFDLP
jgi:hypothetical protein